MTDMNPSLKKQEIKLDRKLINQAEIARRLGVSEALVSLVLNKKRKNERLLARIIEIVKSAA